MVTHTTYHDPKTVKSRNLTTSWDFGPSIRGEEGERVEGNEGKAGRGVRDQEGGVLGGNEFRWGGWGTTRGGERTSGTFTCLVNLKFCHPGEK